jgi:hypothetical protein
MSATMFDWQETWFDEAAGPLVRPYALTGGRTRPSGRELELITLVVTVPADEPSAAPEHERVLEMCAEPQSVAEVAAHAELPLGVAKVLISDLLDRGRLEVCSDWGTSMAPDTEVLQRVLDGIKTL